MKDDCISRQAAIEAIRASASKYTGFMEMEMYTDDDAVEAIEGVPSAQPEYHFDEWCTDCKEYDHERHCCPRFNAVIRTAIEEMEADRKNGHWIDSFGLAQCSVCKTEFFMKYNYCPNCGADMRERKEE